MQHYLRRRIDDFLAILAREVAARPFIAGDRPTVADLSTCGYLVFPADEAGYDLAADYPAIHGWLQRIAALPGWRAPYDLLPGPRLRRYAAPLQEKRAATLVPPRR